MNQRLLKPASPSDCAARVIQPVSAETLKEAEAILAEVRNEGAQGLKACIERFEGRAADALIIKKESLKEAFFRLPLETQELLDRTAARIRNFAEAQKQCLRALEMPIPGGFVGHDLAPIEKAGCYAPGGRFPLPSSVLMTAVTARSAGVKEVWVATPSKDDIMLGAAWIAGADGLLYAGGAQAIAALAYGAGEVPAVDIIVGPGNAWVTAAKQLVSGSVAIDMLAGPSELVVVADEDANPDIIAADLLAQAEHDPDAIPSLVTNSETLALSVEESLSKQLALLDTRDIAKAALSNGAVYLCSREEEILDVVNRLAPEHLELQVRNASELAAKIQHYGGLFIGENAAEVLGDYGAGPNHVLPTGGTARYTGGLNVLSFIRIRTWIRIDNPLDAQGLREDAQALGNLEGLSGHARSAEIRAS